MSQPDPSRCYPWPMQDTACYLKNVITNPLISVGDYTYYHDVDGAASFERRNVLYHEAVLKDRLVIGRFCSIACGVKFIMNGANHTMASLSTYPFPAFGEWEEGAERCETWDVKGDTVVGSDVWIGFESIILPGVHIGDGVIIGARSVVTKDVAPYTIVGGLPAKLLKKRFTDEEIETLLRIRWWDWDDASIQRAVPSIRHGDLAALSAIAASRKG